MFGECCFEVGDIKCTLGTGMFMDVNTGTDPHASIAGKHICHQWGSRGGGRRPNNLADHSHTVISGGSFPFWKSGDFPFYFPDRGKKCQNLSRSGNKMIIFYMPQHIAWRINTNQRIAKTNSLAKS